METVRQDSAVRIVLRGEVDVANADRLRGALDAIELDGARRLCLDMGDLAFLDVAALRELTSFTQRVRQSGRHVEAHGARPSLHRTAGVLGVDDLLGLTPATQ